MRQTGTLRLVKSKEYAPLIFSTSRYGGVFISSLYGHPWTERGDHYLKPLVLSDDQLSIGDIVISGNITEFNHAIVKIENEEMLQSFRDIKKIMEEKFSSKVKDKVVTKKILVNSEDFLEQDLLLIATNKIKNGDKVEVEAEMSEGWTPTYNNPDNIGCDKPAEPTGKFKITLYKDQEKNMNTIEKKLPAIEVPASGKPEWYGGAYTIAFVYAKSGNFIVKGYYREVEDYLKKNHKHWFANYTLWHNREFRSIWDFWKEDVYIHKYEKSKDRKSLKRSKWSIGNYGKSEEVFGFKRLPKRWIPEFENL